MRSFVPGICVFSKGRWLSLVKACITTMVQNHTRYVFICGVINRGALLWTTYRNRPGGNEAQCFATFGVKFWGGVSVVGVGSCLTRGDPSHWAGPGARFDTTRHGSDMCSPISNHRKDIC